MVVVGIAAVLLTIAVPAFVRRLAPQSMQHAVSDVMDACSRARSMAILKGVTTALRIRPGDRVFEVTTVAPATTGDAYDEPSTVNPGAGNQEVLLPGMGTPVGGSGGGAGGSFSVTLDPAIQIEGLGINGEDWTDDAVAEVRFYPNGTCDELTLVLLSERQERRNIWLEVVTGLAFMETDIKEFHAR